MWNQGGIRHWSCLIEPSNYEISPASGSRLHNTAITGHCSQRSKNGPSSSTSWMIWGHFDTGPCGFWKGLQLPCTTSSLSTMTCSITWMALCQVWRRRRHNGRKTCTSLWRLRTRSCPNIMLESLQQLVCFTFQHISLILSRSCDHSGSGTRRWILILRPSRLPLPNTRRRFWSIFKMNTVPIIDEWLSLNPTMSRPAISFLLQRILDFVNHRLIHMICPAMMQNTWCLKAWLKWHPDAAIVQHSHWQPQGSISNHRLNHQRTVCKLIQIIMITTPTPWRLAVHFGHQISPTGGASKRKCSESIPISPMWHTR